MVIMPGRGIVPPPKDSCSTCSTGRERGRGETGLGLSGTLGRGHGGSSSRVGEGAQMADMEGIFRHHGYKGSQLQGYGNPSFLDMRDPSFMNPSIRDTGDPSIRDKEDHSIRVMGDPNIWDMKNPMMRPLKMRILVVSQRRVLIPPWVARMPHMRFEIPPRGNLLDGSGISLEILRFIS